MLGFLFDRPGAVGDRALDAQGRPSCGHQQVGRKSPPLFPLTLIVICGSFPALRRCLCTRNFPRRCKFSLFFTMSRLGLQPFGEASEREEPNTSVLARTNSNSPMETRGAPRSVFIVRMAGPSKHTHCRLLDIFAQHRVQTIAGGHVDCHP